jgi:hypothetical protein
VATQEVESWEGLEHAFLNVHLYGAHPVVTAVDTAADGLLVTVRNDGYGPLAAGATVTLDMPSGSSRTVALPALGPGASAQVALPCEEDGLHALAVQYTKRLEATSNVGMTKALLQIAPAGTPVEDLVLSEDVPAGAFSVVRPAASAQAAPGPGILLVAGLAALAILVRRAGR